MRIILDLQSCQTEGSKNRGIGRYSISLAEAMIRQGAAHEFFVVLNGAFPEAARAVRARLAALLPADRIRTFDIITPCSQFGADNMWRYKASKALREDFIASLDPDAVHMTSLFEGLGDDAITEISPPVAGVIQAITVYDLIPYMNPVPYLESLQVRNWYYRKLQSLKRADLLLAISSSSRDEAVDHLHLPPEAVVNISSSIDAAFRPISLSASERAALAAKHGLGDRFVMYTGGIDHRKNIEGLIEAYASLPEQTRSGRQLAIICSVRDADRTRLLELARRFGLGKTEVVLTGYVSEGDLIGLYNICELFVFPSLHEGFGLPVLEAMACGAPTIGADNSSIPEVIALEEALFDAADPAAIAAKIGQVLDDPAFAQRLKEHGLRQSRNFSWDASARTALKALEAAHAKARGGDRIPPAQGDAPLRLALVSPLPPLRTGIAGYSAALLPELCRYYDVDVVTDQEAITSAWATANCEIVPIEEFKRRDDAGAYDRIVYHVGNSEFHAHMPDLIVQHPGAVVLHDYFLSGLQNWRQATTAGTGHFIDSLIDTHGYPALADFMSEGVAAAIARYPANAHIIQSASGVIVHSRSSAERLARDFGLAGHEMVHHIPSIRTRATVGREEARASLGLAEDDFLICSFGILAPEKKNDILIEAFGLAGLAGASHVRLVFVGSSSGEYGDGLIRQIRDLGRGANVTITGYADDAAYNAYLAASDLAVQLRGGSRGETSAAVLEVLNYGVPLIVNAHDTMAELEQAAVFMLPDEVEAAELAEALASLVGSVERRAALVAEAGKLIRENHAPAVVGQRYRQAIEDFAVGHPLSRQRRLIRQIARDPLVAQAGVEDLVRLADTSARNLDRLGRPRLFVDISLAVGGQGDPERRDWALAMLDAMIADEAAWRIEPVYMAEGDDAVFRTARSFMVRRFGWGGGGIEDRVVAPTQGDVFLGLDSSAHSAGSAARHGLFRQWHARGVVLKFVMHDRDIGQMTATTEPDARRDERFGWLDGITAAADEIVAPSAGAAKDFEVALDTLGASRSEPLRISYPPEDDDGDAAGLMRAAVATPELYRLWTPQPTFRFDGRDSSIGSEVGQRRGRTIASAGIEGFLFYGPYIALPPGTYTCRIWGAVGSGGRAGAWIDITLGNPQAILTKIFLQDIPADELIPGMIASITFELESGCVDLEVRLWVDVAADIVFNRLDLRASDLSDGAAPPASPQLQPA